MRAPERVPLPPPPPPFISDAPAVCHPQARASGAAGGAAGPRARRAGRQGGRRGSTGRRRQRRPGREDRRSAKYMRTRSVFTRQSATHSRLSFRSPGSLFVGAFRYLVVDIHVHQSISRWRESTNKLGTNNEVLSGLAASEAYLFQHHRHIGRVMCRLIYLSIDLSIYIGMRCTHG